MSRLINTISSLMLIIGIDLYISRGIESRNINKTMVNIGSGDWEHKGWINLDYSSKWYSSYHKRHNYKEYDIRKDNIPLEDNSVDCIYCSHVIEHIENQYDEKMFMEAYRVLKPNGVFRIACPDAEFLWDVTKTGKDYWIWRKRWCERMNIDYSTLNAVDFLVREVATPRLIGYGYLQNEGFNYQNDYENMERDEFLSYITKGLVFDPNHAGDHINFWHYDKLSKALNNAGFRIVIRSKYNGSISPFMRSKSFFDKTEPCMSMYVDAVK